MSIQIERSYDIEDEVRLALTSYLTVYCRPLPARFQIPSILVSQVGGADHDHIDTFNVVLDSRADNEADALETLRNAIGILRKVTGEQTTPIRHMEVVSSGSWGADPVRPDLAMCSATLRLIAHLETATI